MPELDYGSFDEFFSALWNHPPFAWQSALARRVLENAERPWPEAIALPTASGKTACLDIAVFALAAQADRLGTGLLLTVPRRIFFVVDRRVIVDEAFERARKLADKLKREQGGIIKDVADRLRKLSGGDIPLAVFQLRGGMYRSNAWAKTPTQPTIVASTVDQLGSRLLFRAYGSGPGTWPIHAGLAGNDALILLDEAHCAQPFLETLRAVNKFRRWGDNMPPLSFHVSVISATPPEGITEIFRDESNEPQLAGHPLGDRQLAAKSTTLEIVTKAKADKDSNSRALEELAAALTKKAEELAEQFSQLHQEPGGKPAVVIFCNRVATARYAWRILEKKYGGAAILLTGRMRPIDKDDTVSGRLSELSADKSKDRYLSAPVFVVATQTLEVGANLDFDVLVTECASLDALRQRFGRLNRMGRTIKAQAAIMVRADQAKNSDDDPVYSKAIAVTWAWLNQQPNLDMGVAALEPRLPTDKGKLAELNAPSAHAPVMLPSHVDCWAQTSPLPQPSPDVTVFLHGPGIRQADVQVCWRADIDLERADETSWQEVLSLCPPSSPECLPVPIGLLRRWLVGQDDNSADLSDVEGERATGGNIVAAIKRKVVRWRGVKDATVLDDPDALRPGDVAVIPASLGGWQELGDLARQAEGQAVLDWGDRSHAQSRAKALLRLHPFVMTNWPENAAVNNLRDLMKTAKAYFEEDPDGLTADLQAVLADLSQDVSTPDWLKKVSEHLAKDKTLISLHPAGGLIVRGRKRLPVAAEEVDLFSDETDAAASGTVLQSLHEHSKGVNELARRFAIGCGLPQSLVDAIEFAASAHDFGKADPRFQSWLQGGASFGQGGMLLAKSADMPQSRVESAKARKRAGYPEGGRHELLSVRLLESMPETLPQDETVRELALHLIESHHGYCRPFAPVVFDETAPKVVIDWNGRKLEHAGPTGMERLDSGVTERFWRLTRRYGWWGLAWLEAVVRLADHRRSEWEENHT